MYTSTPNDFQVRTKRGKQHCYKKHKQIRYLNNFNIINTLTLLSADAKSAILLRVALLTKFEVSNFSLLHFSRWFCLVNGQLAMCLRQVKGRSYVNSNVSVSSMFNNGQFYLKHYFLHLIFPTIRFHFSPKC